MKQAYQQYLMRIGAEDERAELDALTAYIRSILQLAAIDAIELYRQFVGESETGVDMYSHIVAFQTPADGTPVHLLDDIVPAIRSVGWPSFCNGWFEEKNNNEQPLVNILQRWVTFRNNRQGHGVLDERTIRDNVGWIRELARQCLNTLSDLIPEKEERNGELCFSLQTPFGAYEVDSLPKDGELFVVRSIREKRGVWRMAYQTLDFTNSDERVSAIAPGTALVSFDSQYHGGFRSVSVLTDDGEWLVDSNVPPRQSLVFEPREEEFSELKDWFNDLESKSCLVYGDGGIGKTTLLLEFLNEILDGEISGSYKPSIIAYYSAKLTRWTENGIMHFRGISPNLEEAVRQFVAYYEGRIPKEWYKVNGIALVDKVAQLYADLGFNKADLLLIVDNTETLAHSPEDQKNLGRLLTHISRRLARVVITSRRREKIEAKPVEVEPLDEDSGADLFDKLAAEYDIEPLRKAGRATLKKLTRNYAGKPLLIEAHARHMKQLGLSIEDAKQRILQESSDRLGEFLYEDAWRRITDAQRTVFLLLSRCDLPLDTDIVGWACKEAEIPASQWLEAFNETYFGRQHQFGLTSEIEFDVYAREFFNKKYSELDVVSKSSVDIVSKSITKHFAERAAAEKAYVSDRLSEAFRTREAKAAKIATRQKDYENARAWYLEAIEVDKYNPYLFDRFAWYLMKFENDLGTAEAMSKKACELAGEKIGEVYFTLGLIRYRKNELDDGDKCMLKARDLGKDEGICLIQMADARLVRVRDLLPPKTRNDKSDCIDLLGESVKYTKNALGKINIHSSYGRKNIAKCEQMKDLISKLLPKVRGYVF